MDELLNVLDKYWNIDSDSRYHGWHMVKVEVRCKWMSTGIEPSPVIKNEKQYEYWGDILPFYRNIRDEGICVE